MKTVILYPNISNEWYLRDCSRKQCAAYQARGKAGKPTTNHAIFGYQKDPADKHHWLIDEEAAAVVRRIFQLTLNGYGPQQIANVLRDSKVDRPSVYMAKRDSGTCKNTTDMSRPYDWAATTISRILSKPEYMGHTVNFRTYKESYKDKHTISRPPEEWTVFENTHEAIVDPETWQLAQQARRTVHRTDSTGEANPLTGLVYCADCGEKMYNHRRHNQAIKQGLDKDPVSGLYPFDSYDCSTYAQTRQRTEKKCYSHYIGTKALRALIVDTIRTASRYAITNKAEFAERVRQESEIRQAEAAKDMKRKVSRARKRCTELDALIQKLYESFAKGQITDKRFETLCATYEKEQSELEAVITEEQAALDTFNADTDFVEQFMALAKKYTDFSVLTTPMIYEFIDKIFVHAPYKDENGERCQDVDIYLKFIGKFEVPMPEPTQEEIAAQQKVARYRAKKREAAKKHREKKKAEQQKTA